LGKTFQDNGIDVIINEEGKFIEGLKPEIAIVDKQHGQVLDIVYGNCIFASHNEEGETVGLTNEQELIVLGEFETTVELMNKKDLKTFEVKVLFI
jgi:hypothetical protein